MSAVIFNGQKFENWMDYFHYKFGNENIFSIELFDKEIIRLISYRITLKDKKCKTEIIFILFHYLEIFDVYFNHPDSPKLRRNNQANKYGFDGVGSAFNLKNVKDVDEWINIPLYHGWIERTTLYDSQKHKTDCVWQQGDKVIACPIEQNYLDDYGCLLFPIIPIVISIWDFKLKRNKEKITVKENIIEPMIKVV